MVRFSIVNIIIEKLNLLKEIQMIYKVSLFSILINIPEYSIDSGDLMPVDQGMSI